MALQWLVQFGFYTAAVFLVIGVMLGLPALLGERHGTKIARRREIATGVPYESGIRPTGKAHIRIPVQYYLVAMFFVIFDVEAVFLYAWAVTVKETGWPGLIAASIFISTLLAALMYLWRDGALDWSAQFQRPPSRRSPPKAQEQRDALVA